MATGAGPSEGPPAGEPRFRALLDSAPDAVVVIDHNGRIVLVNDQTEAVFRYRREQLVGEQIELLIPERFRAVHVGHRRKYLVDPHVRPMGAGIELAGRRSDGTEFPVDISLSSIDTENEGTLAMAFIRDITARRAAEAELAAANREVALRAAALERRNSEILLVSQMGNLLQSCTSMDEAFDVIARYSHELFAEVPGQVFLQKSGDLLEAVASWGSQDGSVSVFSSDDCWALRRGVPHRGGESSLQPRCEHVRPYGGEYVCVPMIAQSQSMGVVHLRQGRASTARLTAREWEAIVSLAISTAEHIALALANLNLRETLRRQSIRDPLTNLFNRRFLDEYLDRELKRAARSGSPVSVIMLDVDHFKPFNDEYGHAIGDSVLISLARLIQGNLRGGDVACRQGGEEFVLILPDAALEGAAKRAEQLRTGISQMQVAGADRPVQVSLGVSAYPVHGATAKELLQAADRALYRAKSSGRNRVEVESSPEADDLTIHVMPSEVERAAEQDDA